MAKARLVALRGDPPKPVVATDPPAVAASKVMWIHAGRLLDRELEIRDPERIDELRKYRVATRRLRSAIRVFAFALPERPTERLRQGLTELGAAVGAVRDADVRIANAIAHGAGAAAGGESLGPLIAAWRAERARAYVRFMRRIGTKRHRRWLERLAAFVEEPTAARPPTGTRPVTTVRRHAAASVWEAYERVRAYAGVVSSADLDVLHQLRTETKRLRYTLEFLADILGPERASLIATVTALQDHLGAINDTAATADAIQSFLARQGDSLAPGARAAVTEYLAERKAEAGRLRQDIGRAWGPVASEAFARRLGRTVVIV